ncbi:MAG: recombinase family protein [Bacilli bacterium]|jgi:DNA invertase Pin-like site-specific DNA recombinase
MEKVYVRVSTLDQEYDRQISILASRGYTKENCIFYEEKITGTKKNRPLLDKMINELQYDDTLIVESMSRLGRSLTNLIELVNMLIEKKKITIIFLKEGITVSHNKEKMSASDNLMFNVFASLSQFERDLISERTKEALTALQDKGVRLGNPRTEHSTVENFIKTLKLNIAGERIVDACAETSYPLSSFILDLRKYREKFKIKSKSGIVEMLTKELSVK